MLIDMKKSVQCCTPHLKTQQPVLPYSIVHWIIIPILSELQDAPEVLGLIVPANLDAKKSQPVTCL